MISFKLFYKNNILTVHVSAFSIFRSMNAQRILFCDGITIPRKYK